MTITRPRNALVDGWRGISVLLVILGHFVAFRVPGSYPVIWLDSLGFSLGTRTFKVIASVGELGVSFFFTISGFLITSLMMAEEDRNGSVSLPAFYVRRVFRIMPAFYVYVAVIYIFHRSGLIAVDGAAFIRSSAYLCNFSEYSCSWWLAHTWSLAVEEQFYLTWPLLFALLPYRRKGAALALLVVLALGSFFLAQAASFASILVGVLIAMSPAVQQRIARMGEWPIWAALVVLLLSPLHGQLPGAEGALRMARPVLVAVVLFGTLLAPGGTRLGKTVRLPVFVSVGKVSYSLYLWQQLSLAPVQWGGAATGAERLYDGPGNLLIFAFVPAALASYFFLEKPLVAIGQKLSRQITERASAKSSPSLG